MVRVPAEVETDEGVKTVKFVEMTALGMDFDPDSVEE
jgi:hypothetical protein